MSLHLERLSSLPGHPVDHDDLRLALQRATEELAAEREARAKAERAAALKDEFLAVVSHELRNPLGAILGWTDMLRRHGSEEELDKGLEVIEQSAQVQAKLIEDLLDMSRMASNKIRLHLQSVEPRRFIDAAVEAAWPAAAAKDIRIGKVLDLTAGPVLGDVTRLSQVMCNLLTNAVKFTPEGGSIEVTLRSADGYAVILVRDSGIGIAPEFLPQVFERFQQDPATAGGHGGLGLGLAIARQLVALHGGDISASSDGPGRGATFTVRLPLAVTKLSASPAPAGPQPTERRPTL
ncbi:sensor histidine kinase [Ramlibacter tataouinensis]|uniref:sensor histidine kinase n=1 Tax=Ramlibacter tataouinensis TaxID=94132 RepID=UPI000776F51B|nr:HAMP domain-containing sensor histidine kinase [Ramlibacter tataouinensis]